MGLYRRGFWISLLCWLHTNECSTILREPQDFDALGDNSSLIVVGSVIQLFCSASGQFTASNIQWTRNNITIPGTAHLIVKSWTENNTITSSVLTIYGFSTSDNGRYQCNASDINSSPVSLPLELTATNGSNVLVIKRELSTSPPDRTSVPLGSSNVSSSSTFLRCSAQKPGSSSSLTAPSMTWLKDGTLLSGDGVRVVITTTAGAGITNRTTTSYVRITKFSQSDAGVYQCVFYDTPSQGGEVITTRPYKVDTGSITLSALSPSWISLCPPEPLVIQVEAGGEYAGIQWTRTPIALNVSSDELVDFQQTFVRTVTSEEDWGLYYVSLLTTNSISNITVTITVTCNFTMFETNNQPNPTSIVQTATNTILMTSASSMVSGATVTASNTMVSSSAFEAPLLVIAVIASTVAVSMAAILVVVVISFVVVTKRTRKNTTSAVNQIAVDLMKDAIKGQVISNLNYDLCPVISPDYVEVLPSAVPQDQNYIEVLPSAMPQDQNYAEVLPSAVPQDQNYMEVLPSAMPQDQNYMEVLPSAMPQDYECLAPSQNCEATPCSGPPMDYYEAPLCSGPPMDYYEALICSGHPQLYEPSATPKDYEEALHVIMNDAYGWTEPPVK